MSINNDLNVDDGTHKTCIDLKWLLCVFSFSVPVVHAETPSEKYHSLKNNIAQLLAPKSNQDFKVANMQKLSNFTVTPSNNNLPVVGSGRPMQPASVPIIQSQPRVLKDAVQIAV